jgi:prephenate dehydratase
MSKEIAYLGPKATFTDLAASHLFPNEITIPMATIPDCLDAVKEGKAAFAVVPIENALEGSVNITIDYLVHEVKLPIKGEITTPIEQHYLIHPDQDAASFMPEILYSHSHAIAQCHKFLHKELKGIPYEYVTSTAAAAKMVKENPDKPIAAIANELAASEYGLTIAKRNVHDYSHNHTKFIVVSNDDKEVDYSGHLGNLNGYKTTLMVLLPADHSGALHQVLSTFAWRKLNLSKIESRPMKTGLGHYFFLIDIVMQMDDILIPGAISEMEALGCSVTILGSYPSFTVDTRTSVPL